MEPGADQERGFEHNLEHNLEHSLERARRACRDAAGTLREAGTQPEALAELVPEGRRFGVLRRPATMRPLGEVWRLGVLLLGAGGVPMLHAAGRATRAAERGRPNYQDLSREDRRDIAAAALRGGYPVGAPVNFDATPLPLDTGPMLALGPDAPIGVHGATGEVRVRWRPGASIDSAPALARYLEERVGLLVDPPLSST